MTRLIVIGGDAAGASAASVAKRRRPDLDVVMVERGDYTSYAACGLPYWISGDVESSEKLISRDPAAHRSNGLDVRMHTEAVVIDPVAGTVSLRTAQQSDDAATTVEHFDHLVIATGAAPIRPPIPGAHAPNVAVIHTIGDSQAVIDQLEPADGDTPPRRAVVVGAGFIGLEMAEAFLARGLEVTILDQASHPMVTMDPDMGDLIAAAMDRDGITCAFDAPVAAIDVGTDGNATAVRTRAASYPADVVVLALGVRPETALAANAGLPLGAAGGILTDDHQRVLGTENIWAAGDCVETFHRLLGCPVHIPLGTHANKQGFIAGSNIAGADLTFPGVIGTAITKVADTHIARTGLSEQQARAAGFDVVAATVRSNVIAGYMPNPGEMATKLVAEAGSGRLLGGQIVGTQVGAAKRIDTVATAIWGGLTAVDMVYSDLAYAPPSSPVWDPVQIAARRVVAAL